MSVIDAGQQFLIDQGQRTLAPTAVASQVGLMSAVSVVTVLLFNFLRPKNKIIYEPKVKYHEGDKPPPRISDSLLGWLPPLLHTKEPELLDKIGLDAVAYLRFLRLMRWLFTGTALLCCAVLIPVNVVYNLNNVKPKARDILTILTIRDVKGSFLYAHVTVTYLITFLVIFCVNHHWKEMVRLRHTWFRSPEYLQSFYARTLQVRHVPKKFQSDAGLTDIFNTVKVPYPTTSVHIGRKVGKLPELIEYHNQTVREFEEILVKYLKGGKIKAKRPTIRIGGTCGMGGQKKDAIDFYTAKLKRTEAAIEDYRNQIDNRKAENYGFASMAAVPYAHIVAKFLASKHPKGTAIDLAPNPKDIIWKNMDNTDGELARKRLIGIAWLFLVCFFNTVPLLIISFLANLDAMRVYVDFLEQWHQASKGTFTFVSGVLPPAISALFGFFLPIVMRWLTRYMGALTHSKLDRAVVARYFAFLIISQLVIFTLIGVIFNAVQQIIISIGEKASFQKILENLDTLPDTINATYINQASYWLTFFPLRGFLVLFDLAQIINLVWLSIKTRIFGRTPRDIREWTQPPEFQYAVYYSNTLFMGAVGLFFAPLAPLVVVAAAIVMWLSSWVYKYQLMFVFVSKVESGGRIWNVIINRLLVCAVLMQALMVLTIGLQYKFSSFQWVSTVPPILFIIAFKIYINRTYVPAFNYFSPTEEEIRMAKVHSERADAKGSRLEKRFGHPALHAELFTPMLHKSMMPLLSQVYSGKIGKDSAKLDEYGGQQMEAQIVPGGIKIAAIDQRDLEYDPVLYQRDRGELDWDARSIASTNMLEGPGTAKSAYASSTTLANYDNYLAYGPGSSIGGHSDIELTKLDSMSEPLLSPKALAMQNQGFVSQQSLTPSLPASMYNGGSGTPRPIERSYSPSPAYASTDNLGSPHSPYHDAATPTQAPSSYFPAQQQHARQASGNMLSNQPPQHGRQMSGNMLANQPQHGRQMSGNILVGAPRTQSPGPHQAYPPSPQQAQHGRQMSANMLAQGRQSPGPAQMYPPPQHGRQMSGNMLAQGRQSPGPGPAYYQGQGGPQQQHGRQMSGNMLAQQGRQSPGPYQAYGPPSSPQPQLSPQHGRQMSGNMLAAAGHAGHPPSSRTPSPGPYQAYSPQQQQYPQQQQHSPGGAGNMAGRGANRDRY